MAKLLTESNFDINIDRDSNKNLYIEGIFAGYEQLNGNGRIYPKSVLESQVEKILESVNGKSCLGELNHPENRAEVSLSDAAILIEDLQWKGKELHGRAKVLSGTPKGMILKGLLDAGVKLGISSRGLGETKFDEKRNADIVTDSYRLLTWDVVQKPSHKTAWVKGIYEGMEFTIPGDIKNPSDKEVKESLLDIEKGTEELIKWLAEQINFNLN